MERGRSLLIFKVKGHISRSLDGYLGNFMWFKSNCWFKLKIYMSGVCCYTQCCSCFFVGPQFHGRYFSNKQNGFTFSKTKTKCVHFCQLRRPHNDPVLRLDSVNIPIVEEYKFLGVIFDKKLSFIPHIKYLKAKCHKALQLLRIVAHTD